MASQTLTLSYGQTARDAPQDASASLGAVGVNGAGSVSNKPTRDRYPSSLICVKFRFSEALVFR